MTEEKPKGPVVPWYMVIIGTLLSWLGLAGLADGIVEWKEWFEVGIFQHYRAVQGWVIDNLLFWFPLGLPEMAIDYCIIGVVFTRSFHFANENRRLRVSRFLGPIQIYSSYWQLSISMLAVFSLWPIILFISTLRALLNLLGSFPNEIEYSIDMTIVVFFTSALGLFIPVLFVISDIGYTFGILPAP
ncbi:MAG: hypothetical protein AAGC57_20765 [Pseudomonadota bacterium]